MGYLDKASKARSMITLYLLPLFLVAVGCLCYQFCVRTTPCCESGLLINFENFNSEGWSSVFLNALALSLFALGVYYVASRYKFLNGVTVLPPIIYSFLTVGIVSRYGIDSNFVAAVVALVALARLQASIESVQRNAPIFDVGLTATLAVLIAPKSIILPVWAIIALPFSGRTRLKDFLAMLLGSVVAIIFVGSFFLLTDQIEELSTRFLDILQSGENYMELLSENPLPFSILTILLIISLFHLLGYSPFIAVAKRRALLLLLYMVLFMTISLFLIPYSCATQLLILFIPVAYIYSQFFLLCRRRWIGILFMLLLLLASVLMILYA